MPSILNATTSTGFTVTPDNSGSLQLATNNGTTAVTIDTSQNVGVGTTSPSQKLDVTGNARLNASSSPVLQLSESGTLRGSITGSSTIGLYFQTFTTTPMRFDTNGSERMRITSGGDVLVGFNEAAPVTNNNDGFAVLRDATNGMQLQITRAAGQALRLNRRGSDGEIASFSRSGTQVGNISVTTTATAYNTSSDYRLKENIAPMTGALATVVQLKPVTYTWKIDGSASQGFIAHELQAVVPDAVTGEKDAVDEEGNPVHQGVDTSFLVATLTAAIQELKAVVDAQAVEIAALKTKVGA